MQLTDDAIEQLQHMMYVLNKHSTMEEREKYIVNDDGYEELVLISREFV